MFSIRILLPLDILPSSWFCIEDDREALDPTLSDLFCSVQPIRLLRGMFLDCRLGVKRSTSRSREIERAHDEFGPWPERLIADTGYGSAVDKSKRKGRHLLARGFRLG
ncbi:hypothetical protein GCM10010869_68100 [Mesorhizobium tianshanense]|uniref:hypothetical protein n=1 Tax=Mesorhizobium tianshanense TaxID=39844 RepID=UPI0011A8C5BB|nr:hypothetical protein [Mesorhizobium tianshanense]GLS41213.1 hypothetical protein GCM10010869_68100 [Mesorhizobium tianshanense]